MRPILLTLIMCVGLTVTTGAEIFEIGDLKIEIPVPTGYVRVTGDMGPLTRAVAQMSKTSNSRTLAHYVTESSAEMGREGALPTSNNTCTLQFNDSFGQHGASPTYFAKFKEGIKLENKTFLNKAMPEIRAHGDKVREGFSREFGKTNFLGIDELEYLEAHYETPSILSFSSITKHRIQRSDGVGERIVTATATFVNVAGKVIILLCHGEENDLERTRAVAKHWADAIVAANPSPPANRGDVPSGVTIMIAGISGALIGIAIRYRGYYLPRATTID